MAGGEGKKLNHVTHDVIVCVHNAPLEVQRCLESLVADLTGISRVIVVDDCSSTETKELLDRFRAACPKISIVRPKEQQRYTKAANMGLRASSAQLRTLLNSDTIVPRGWAHRIQDKFCKNPELGILGPLSNAASYQSVPEIVGTSTQTAVNDLPVGVSIEQIDQFCAKAAGNFNLLLVPVVHGFCFTVTAECIKQIGYFDAERFPQGYGEENDYCFRASDAGFGLGVALDTFIFHAKSKSYQTSERVALMQQGWEALVDRVGRRRLTNAVRHMESQPRLSYMREEVRRAFYAAATSKPNEVKVVAFYLPQFHPVPENDLHWGEGFTEWRNVVRARPRFPGHNQPKLPGKFGFYDLRVPEIQQQQIQLAAEFGVDCFCMYYYRFGPNRIMGQPVKIFRALSQEDVSFCYCWANESWTRAWDGATSDIIVEQKYDAETLSGLVDDLADAILDDAYFRLNGRPVFVIYQVAEIPERELWISRLRQEIYKRTGHKLLIGSVYSLKFTVDMLKLVDFVVQFPPHRIPRNGRRITIREDLMRPFDAHRNDYYEDYETMSQAALSEPCLLDKMFLGVCPDWDNTPRRERNAHTLVGSSPEKFEKWVREAALLTIKRYQAGKIAAPCLFVNAWNEWAEGAVLEPSERYGEAYLQALRSAFHEIDGDAD